MQRTKIEWVKNPDGSQGFTWNPITGCLGGCPYCYARKIAKRFKQSFEPTFHPERLDEPMKRKKPSTIFVCSVSDLFGNGMYERWRQEVLLAMREADWHIYLLLTKRPWNYNMLIYKVSMNAWLGATASGFWPTPTIHGNSNRKGASKKSGDGLATAVRNYPTPTVASAKQGKNEADGKRGQTLISAVRGQKWPTPKASDGSKAPRFYARGNPSLPQAVKIFPSPKARDYRTGKKPEHRQRRSPNLNDVSSPGGTLNPTWVEWLMGWPLGWTELKPLATDKFRQWLQQHGIF